MDVSEVEVNHAFGLQAEEAVQLLTAPSSSSALRGRDNSLLKEISTHMTPISNSLCVAKSQVQSVASPYDGSQPPRRQAAGYGHEEERERLRSSGELLSMFIIACSSLACTRDAGPWTMPQNSCCHMYPHSPLTH
jgi:hypothetical protein